MIETIVHDTTIEQRVETKPLYVTVRDTVFEKTKDELMKAENKRLKAENKTMNRLNTGMAIAYSLGAVGMLSWLWSTKRKD